MFTGIIESIAKVVQLKKQEGNIVFTFSNPFVNELQLGQSIAHNGVCLTVNAIHGDSYEVTAISETLSKTNLGQLNIGDEVNIERAMPAHGRFEGHIVQGHVDTTCICKTTKNDNGSSVFTFEHTVSPDFITVKKGSVCVNGVSLTVLNDATPGSFSVAVIPYTLEHTNFKFIKEGSKVNIEFDILGKYFQRINQHNV